MRPWPWTPFRGHDERDSTSLPTDSARARENLGRGVEGLRVG